ncbi:MAG TPA: hypothetical protein VHG72_13925 [Polyangia bacterium]|nr:hypothetical protein [Polyangia bacterium]
MNNADDFNEPTARIPVQSMAALVFGSPSRPARRVRLPVRLIFVAALLGATVGCNAAVPPPAPETVGTLAAGPSVWHAPTHADTDLTPGFQAVEGDDSATETVTTVSAAADAGNAKVVPDGSADGTELPEVVGKGEGLKMGEAR